MATGQDSSKVAVKMPDPAKLAEAWTSVLVKGIEAIRTTAERGITPSAPAPYDPLAPAQAFSDFANSLWSNPAQLIGTQQKLFVEWGRYWSGGAAKALGKASDPVVAPEKGDRRFNDPAWDQPFFDHVTSNCCANSASVFSPFTAANATFALNAGL